MLLASTMIPYAASIQRIKLQQKHVIVQIPHIYGQLVYMLYVLIVALIYCSN